MGSWRLGNAYGGAKSEESSLDAIKREVKEETGLDVVNGCVVYSYFNEDPKGMIIILWIFIILSLIFN